MNAETERKESLREYFERRVREAAADIKADWLDIRQVTRRKDGLDSHLASLRSANEYISILFDPLAPGGSLSVRLDHIDRQIESATDLLYAVTHTEIPDGAVHMALGSTRVFGQHEDLPPIVMVGRANRTYQREGDAAPSPWPPVVFYNRGRQGVVVRTTEES